MDRYQYVASSSRSLSISVGRMLKSNLKIEKTNRPNWRKKVLKSNKNQAGETEETSKEKREKEKEKSGQKFGQSISFSIVLL